MSNDTLLAAIDAEIRGLEEAPKAAGRRRDIWNEGGPGEEGGPEAAPAGRGGSGADCRGATQPLGGQEGEEERQGVISGLASEKSIFPGGER